VTIPSTEERLKRAAQAGKKATASPYEKQAKASGMTKVWTATIYVFETYIALWLGRNDAPWWVVWGFWALLCIGILTTLFLAPLAGKIKRRQMLLAREQVHRVRQLDPADPVTLGLGHLFDADPGLDRLSAEAGMRFTLARVNAVLDEVEAATPKPSMWGHVVNDDGTTTKAAK
jgi:hypothetical protein